MYNHVSYTGANVNTCGGPGGNWIYTGSNVVIAYNETDHMLPAGYPTSYPSGACDWLAFDLDGSTRDSVIEYNYSHDNAGPGMELYIAQNGTNI